MEIRAIAPNEWKYTYAQSTQLEGQTGVIGHLRGDFASSGYGFYTTWFDTRPQRKSDEFKAEFDEVINSLREDKGLLHNRYDMSSFARRFPIVPLRETTVPNTASVWILKSTPICSAAIPQRATITFTVIAMSRNGLTGISAMPKRASVLSTLITRSCFVSQTAAKSVLLPLGAKSLNAPAAILTSITLKSAITSIISASLPSVWNKTVRPMSRYLPSRRRSKHRSIKI